MWALEKITRYVIDLGVAPAAAAGWAVRARHAPRAWRIDSTGDEVVFDLASVTKPMTAVAFARSGLDPRAPLASVLPELENTASARVPLELFLAHRAGLEAHLPLFEPLVLGGRVDAAEALVTAANARRVDAVGAPPPDGFAPVYSDMSYMLAGAALARHVGARDAGDAIASLVLEPLGIADSVGTARQLEARGIDLAARAAPTEIVSWRGDGRAVTGRVHDENCWALTADGGSGHAGMFGTVRGVLTFGCAVLDAVRPLSNGDARPSPFAAPLDLSWLVRERPGGTLRAGFDGKSREGSSAGARLGEHSFGHLGFTGTSLWIDPDAEIVVVLLTNRVCPSRENVAIRAARPLLHDALFEIARASQAQG